MSEPNKPSDHKIDDGMHLKETHDDSHHTPAHDAHGHEVVAGIIAEDSTQDKVLISLAYIVGLLGITIYMVMFAYGVKPIAEQPETATPSHVEQPH